MDAIHVENGLTPEQLGFDGRGLAAYTYGGDGPVWGVDFGDDYGTSHAYPLANAQSVAEVEQYAWPDPARFTDWNKLGAVARDWQQQYAVRGPYWMAGPLFCTTCNLMGMEEALMKMVSEPAVFEACVEKVFEFSCDYVSRFIQACDGGLDLLSLADDFATQRGLMFHPDLWRKFLKPRYARLFELGKRHGLPVWFHSCGDATPVLPDLIDIGVDVWETVQLHALPMSPQALKKQFGRQLTFFGGINTQHLPFAKPKEVRAEVNRVIEALGEGGGYICGPDHHIKPDVSQENTRALFETAQQFRRAGYTG